TRCENLGPLRDRVTASATDDFLAVLPCPEPLPTAIEGHLFGIEVGGPVVPDTNDVASITEEHARQMAVLLTDLAYLERCSTLGVAPESGRRPRTNEARERLAARLAKDVRETRCKYELCVDLYEQAF